MTAYENTLRAIRFEHPDYIPMSFCINDACWAAYPHDFLFEMMETHPLLFPHFTRPEEPFVPNFSLVARKDAPFTDDFGCVWQTSTDGITGTVTGHPLASWDNFASYQFPDPEVCMGIGPIDWEATRRQILDHKRQGLLTGGGLRHGHTFLQLCDIRGYENLMFDMADEEELLFDLIQKVEDFNMHIVKKYLDMGVDIMSYPEDLGMQTCPMLSPEHFERYIKPSYTRLIEPARKKGAMIHMHSDGNLHALIDGIIGSGVEIINLQDLVNGIDWIKHRLAGKTCIELDIDRQLITPFGTPEQVDALIREEVSALGSKEGGLMFIYGLYPGVPMENIKALMNAMERYALVFR